MECPPNQQRPADKQDARAEAPADASSPVRCILALPASERHIPPDLAEAFAARHIEVRESTGPFDAMAKLMLAARDESSAIAVVLVEPETFGARGEELLRSTAKFAPRAARWVYSDALSPRLQKWTDPPPPPAPKVNGIRDAIRETTGQPNLRLTGHDTPAAPVSHSDAAEDDAAGAMLTEEELTMLLSDDDFEADAPPGANSDEHKAPPPPYDQMKP